MAVVGVLIGHFLPVPGFNAGRAGVEMFFSLSGCLISAQLFNKLMPLREFGVKRFARIVPSMWLIIFISVLIAYFSGETMRSPWMYVFGVGNYAVDGLQRVSHLWSVGIELQGYAVLAVIAYVSRKIGARPGPWILTIIFASWSLILFGARRSVDYYGHYWRFEYRLTAMLFSAYLMTHNFRPKYFPDWRLLLTLGLCLQVDNVPDFIKYTLGSVVIAVACRLLFEVRHRTNLENPIITAFGTASFSIYLYQQMFTEELALIGRWWALVLAVCVGFVAHHLWDQRLNRVVLSFLMQTIFRRWRPAA